MFYIRNKVTQCLLKLSFFFAKIIAVAPVQFDYKTGEITTSPHILVYTVCVHVVCIILIPITSNAKYDEVELFQRKPLALSINNLHVFSKCLAIVVTMIWSWVRRERLNRCIEDFYSIQRKHFANVEVSSSLRRQFDILVLSKFIITVYQIFAVGFAMYSLNPTPTVGFSALSFYIVFIQSMLIVTPNHIFLGVLLARIRFRVLNEQLCMIVRQIKLMHVECEAKPRIGMRMQISCDLADKIDEVSRCHRRNIRFVMEVTRIYQFPLLMIVVAFFITNVVFAFFVLLFIVGKEISITAFRTLVSAQNILVNVVELGILVFVCDRTVEASDYPGVLLRELTELYPAVVDERLEMSLEEFSLNLMREKLEFKLCGLFWLDTKLMFMMASSMFMYLLILIQFDYKSLTA